MHYAHTQTIREPHSEGRTYLPKMSSGIPYVKLPTVTKENPYRAVRQDGNRSELSDKRRNIEAVQRKRNVRLQDAGFSLEKNQCV